MQLKIIAILDWISINQLVVCSVEYQKRVKNVKDNVSVSCFVHSPKMFSLLSYRNTKYMFIIIKLELILYLFLFLVHFSLRKLLRLVNYQNS